MVPSHYGPGQLLGIVFRNCSIVQLYHILFCSQAMIQKCFTCLSLLGWLDRDHAKRNTRDSQTSVAQEPGLCVDPVNHKAGRDLIRMLLVALKSHLYGQQSMCLVHSAYQKRSTMSREAMKEKAAAISTREQKFLPQSQVIERHA